MPIALYRHRDKHTPDGTIAARTQLGQPVPSQVCSSFKSCRCGVQKHIRRRIHTLTAALLAERREASSPESATARTSERWPPASRAAPLLAPSSATSHT